MEWVEEKKGKGNSWAFERVRLIQVETLLLLSLKTGTDCPWEASV